MTLLFGFVSFAVMQQSAVFDRPVMTKCLPSEEPMVAKASKRGVVRS